MTIRRVWRGWTLPKDADAYEALLLSEIVPGIGRKAIPGYRGIEILRRQAGDEVEFATIMTFDTLANVVDFQGPDFEAAYVPEAARRVPSRWDERSSHYEVVAVRSGTTVGEEPRSPG